MLQRRAAAGPCWSELKLGTKAIATVTSMHAPGLKVQASDSRRRPGHQPTTTVVAFRKRWGRGRRGGGPSATVVHAYACMALRAPQPQPQSPSPEASARADAKESDAAAGWLLVTGLARQVGDW